MSVGNRIQRIRDDSASPRERGFCGYSNPAECPKCADVESSDIRFLLTALDSLTARLEQAENALREKDEQLASATIACNVAVTQAMRADNPGRDTSAADVDGAESPAGPRGHHESVGERQGRQPAPETPAALSTSDRSRSLPASDPPAAAPQERAQT